MSSQLPIISVVTPTFNRCDELVSLIHSINNQTLESKYFELIICDDGSTDSTEKIVEDLLKKINFNLIYIFQKNSGPGNARNNGVKNAKGELIIFTDSDCEAEENWLNNIYISYLSENFDAFGGPDLSKDDFIANASVGIGTTTPGKALEVIASADNDGIEIGSSSGNVRVIDFTRTTSHANPTARIQVTEPGATHTSDMRFFTSDASGSVPNILERMRIKSDGNIGIGTTTPNQFAKLQVVDGNGTLPTMHTGDILIAQNNDDTTDIAAIYAIAGNAGSSHMVFGDTDSKNPGRVSYYHDNNYMSFHTSANEYMRLTSDGKLGIGTTSPLGNKVHIHVGDSGIDSVTTNSSLVIESNTNNFIQMLNPNGNNSGIIFGEHTDIDVASILHDGGDNSLRFKVAAAEVIRINGSGNVGIGTTSPSNKLTVEDTIGIKRSGVAAITTLQMAGSGLIVNGHSGYHPLIVQANGTEVMRVTQDNKISGSAASTGSFGRVETDEISSTGGTGNVFIKTSASSNRLGFDPANASIFSNTTGIFLGSNNGSNSIIVGNGTGTNPRISKNGSGEIEFGSNISGSSTVTASFGHGIIDGNLEVGGTVTAQEFHTEVVSSSIVFQSGSTKFGDSDDDKHNFSGSIKIDGANNAVNLEVIGLVNGHGHADSNNFFTLASGTGFRFFDSNGEIKRSGNIMEFKSRQGYRFSFVEANYGMSVGTSANTTHGFNLALSGSDGTAKISDTAGNNPWEFNPDGNNVFSGSASSTGSFGQLLIPQQGNNIAINALGGNFTVSNAIFSHTANGGNLTFGTATAGMFHSSGQVRLRKDAGFGAGGSEAFKAQDWPYAAGFWVDSSGNMELGTGTSNGNTVQMASLSTTGDFETSGSLISTTGNISGSATSTGSFGRILGDSLLIESSTGGINVVDTDSNLKSVLLAGNSLGAVGTYSNHPFHIRTDTTDAIVVDTSQNSTFSGNIISTKTNGLISGSSSSTGSFGNGYIASELNIGPANSTHTGYALDVSGSGSDLLSLNSADTTKLTFRQGGGLGASVAFIQKFYQGSEKNRIYLGNSTDIYTKGSGGTRFFVSSGDTQALTIDNSANVTINNGNLETSGKVGIGKNPNSTYALDIQQPTGTNNDYIQGVQDNGSNTAFRIDTDSGDNVSLRLYNGSGAQKIHLNAGGTSTFGASVDVTGNIVASNYLKAGGNLIVGSVDGIPLRFDDSDSTDSTNFSSKSQSLKCRLIKQEFNPVNIEDADNIELGALVYAFVNSIDSFAKSSIISRRSRSSIPVLYVLAESTMIHKISLFIFLYYLLNLNFN